MNSTSWRRPARACPDLQCCRFVYLNCPFEVSIECRHWSSMFCRCFDFWTYWGFPRMGVPNNGWFIGENLLKMDDLGVPPIFGNLHMSNDISKLVWWDDPQIYLLRFPRLPRAQPPAMASAPRNIRDQQGETPLMEAMRNSGVSEFLVAIECRRFMTWQYTHTSTHTYICMYVCMYVCMYLCVYVCMYACK